MKRLVLLLAFTLASVASHAANIALFADTAFVDYAPANSSAEASNMQAALTAAGHTVTPFTGTAAAAWTAALSGKSVLVIPEQEEGGIAAALPGATLTVVANFVNGGGQLIVSDDYRTPAPVRSSTWRTTGSTRSRRAPRTEDGTPCCGLPRVAASHRS